MRDNKKIFIALTVVVAGVMLGTIFSLTFSSKKNEQKIPTSANPQQTQNTNNQGNNTTNSTPTVRTGEIEVNLIAQPNELKNNEALPTDLTKAQRANLGISYTNNTSSDLTGVQIEISNARDSSTPIAKYKTSPSRTAVINKDATTAGKRPTYNVADVKAGETKQVSIFIYPQEKGSIRIQATVRSKEGKIGVSEPVTIEVQ